MARKDLEQRVEENTIMLNVIEKDIETIKSNHLKHISDDIESIKKSMEKMDTRMWAILILLITASMANMFGEKIISLL
tara:strand:- start:1152 stop:1385 length:234 start_codon:yes stop_codon:yes gene_type:complete